MTFHLILPVLISLGASCAAFQMLPARSSVSSHFAVSDRFTNRLVPAPAPAWTVISALPQQQQQQQCRRTRTGTTHLFMGLLDDFLSGGDKSKRKADNEKYLATLQERVARINGMEESMEELDDDELAGMTPQFRQRIQSGGEALDGPILEEAFAVVREAAWRVLELRHYDVQLIGGMVLHDGRLAEMATGEGKTLVATLPAYLNALSGKPSFVITVNDYLARRDMEKMGQIHRFLGLSVGLIQSGMTIEQRREAYRCDVVYVTNSELGFDYLRDNLALSPEQTVLPPNIEDCFCIVDEADSVLIDEARTPLILSEQVPAPARKYTMAKQLANALKPNVHYKVDLKNKNAVLTQEGYEDAERALGIDSLFALQPDGESWAPFVVNAVKAKELFTKDVEYSVTVDEEGNPTGVGIIDAFTGRVLEGRRWSDGLHQSIEALEGIPTSTQSKVIAKVTYQALFRMFSRLSGMTGTAMADAAEFEAVYGLVVTPIPTALPVARRDYPDVAFKTRAAANRALVKEIKNVGGGQEGGRPCLVGTTSVAQSEIIVQALAEAGISAELLNASPKNAPREAEIVAQAGRLGVVTVATNMAGRGTDILLGGCPTTMSRIKTRSFLIEFGILSAKEVEKVPPTPPDSYFPCDLDAECLSILEQAAGQMKAACGDGLTSIEFEEILTVAFDTTESEDDPTHIVQLRNAADAVKEVFGNVLEQEKKQVKDMGGLYVMGTNRHESSRIDQQLRGRAGRQGDPGSSRFFLSFEDDMFVIFGGDKLQNILKVFRVSEDMPVEAKQVSDALDKVQRTVEEKFRSIREEIFRFDEVLNSQRRAIYNRRNAVLFSSPEASLELIARYNVETVNEIINAKVGQDGVVVGDKAFEKLVQFFPPLATHLSSKDLAGMRAEDCSAKIVGLVNEMFETTSNEIEQRARSSGKGPGSLGRSCNYITLATLDKAWSGHLTAMENLKEAVLLRTYQGRNPVSEYQNDSFKLFESLENTMRLNAVYSLWQSLVTSSPVKQAA